MAPDDKDQYSSNTLGLTEAETALLDLAADDRREVLSVSSKEELLLQLYDQIQELELERAILEQDAEETIAQDVEEQLSVAERELLEARATFTVRRKATESILMTDPILKAVHLKAASPAERALLPLINRRDVLSLVYENLVNARTTTVEALSNAEVENLRLMEQNKGLASELLELTAQETLWRDRIDDEAVIAQMEDIEQEYKKTRARRDTIKSVISALVVGSGVDWARDDRLRSLVLDELD
ncbi:hypothetical protein TMatcc_004704 [Talaromyces marneffei ATCC 18224]|uniref:Centromere protein H C-terminal domain-containing protein n=2 Tax=Talaromyces marneffei TaxID=37727 RepID=B6Q331_TALMQ|nr:uncharacterized protein EYB26_000368 [Talaromyces marneffei]EEA27015.1 conserved hypothetical protein [Talaromyces marneffei ATCC 18224]KAE8557259.1 hypothetical protein EYB25_001965 [Talaromyces marneffei]QGA12723.1 hypothetical protein EYB26_000368 [Talaromyces marneffei]